MPKLKTEKGRPTVQYESAFGAQQLTLNDNRPSLQAESLFFLQNAVSIKIYQLIIDEAIWLLTPLVYVRTVAGLYYFYLIGGLSTGFLLALPGAMLMTVFAFLWTQSAPTHGGAIAFRAALLTTGIILGFVL